MNDPRHLNDAILIALSVLVALAYLAISYGMQRLRCEWIG